VRHEFVGAPIAGVAAGVEDAAVTGGSEVLRLLHAFLLDAPVEMGVITWTVPFEGVTGGCVDLSAGWAR
jgi:hypothetical protein